MASKFHAAMRRISALMVKRGRSSLSSVRMDEKKHCMWERRHPSVGAPMFRWVTERWWSYRVDFARIRRRLGFQADWDARSSAKDLYEGYVQHGLTAEAFERRFKRLPWLSRLRAAGRIGRDLRPVSEAVASPR